MKTRSVIESCLALKMNNLITPRAFISTELLCSFSKFSQSVQLVQELHDEFLQHVAPVASLRVAQDFELIPSRRREKQGKKTQFRPSRDVAFKSFIQHGKFIFDC